MCNDTAIRHDKAMKYDGEKVRLDLLPVAPLLGVGKVLTFGAQKYGARNWEKGLDWSRCYGAALRHLFAWWNGETFDNETQLNHLDHAICELMFLREFAETHPELDDRPNIPKVETPKAQLDPLGTINPADVPSPAPLAKSWIDCVEEFNRTYGVKTLKNFDGFGKARVKTQIELINEEIKELCSAFGLWREFGLNNKGEILDAICDSIYVLIGLALQFDFDLDGAFREVHRSNMSKLGEDGKPIKREDGKILKGPNFTPPDLTSYI